MSSVVNTTDLFFKWIAFWRILYTLGIPASKMLISHNELFDFKSKLESRINTTEEGELMRGRFNNEDILFDDVEEQQVDLEDEDAQYLAEESQEEPLSLTEDSIDSEESEEEDYY
mgnify:CR=1 FL=1